MKENKTAKINFDELSEDFPLYYHLWEKFIDDLWESLQNQQESKGAETAKAFFDLYTQQTGKKKNTPDNLMFIAFCGGLDKGIDIAEMLREDGIKEGKITTMELLPGERELLLAYRQAEQTAQYCARKILDCAPAEQEPQIIEFKPQEENPN